MLIWSELHPYLRGLVLTGLFVMMCISLCLIPIVFRRGGTLKKILLFLCASGSFGCVTLFGAGMKGAYYGVSQSAASLWVEGISGAVPALILLAVGIFLAALLIEEVRYRKKTITRSSVRESIDHLPTGLCFSNKIGVVLLANHRMYDLCQQIVGRDLQNAWLFWEILSKGVVCDDVERLTQGEQPSFRLPDGTVWAFSRSISGGVVQLMAADITRLQKLADDLVETNLDLTETNLRLREYGKNAEQLARLQEQLDTKARLHSQFGQALLATRHFLVSQEETADPVLHRWEETIGSLRSVKETPPIGGSLESLKDAAQAAGLSLDIHGRLPDQPKTATLFLFAAMEALTNAVRHADARCLHFEIFQTQDMDIARFANDGNIPTAPVTEGGGLGSLRRKTEQAGGTMTIETKPAFALVLTIPKERSDEF
jgi:signal transduction histidine kinase